MQNAQEIFDFGGGENFEEKKKMSLAKRRKIKTSLINYIN